MRHFSFLADDVVDELFVHAPVELTPDDPPQRLGMALGATLYMPGTRPGLVDDIRRRSAAGVMSVVVCLEDAVADHDLPAAERNVVEQLSTLARSSPRSEAPLLFVRVRSPEQLLDITARLGEAASRLTGFVLPKFSALTGPPFLESLAKAEALAGVRLLAMPVLESADFVYDELRRPALHAVRELLDEHRDRVLALRLGAADLGGLYGLRRTRGVSVYDVGVLRDVISDVVNVLGRADGTGHLICGPVWEHFAAPERLFRPQLRQTPFEEEPTGMHLRERLITADQDELLREVVLDKANGLVGKTVIHPSHVASVHALLVVSHEEHDDALAIVAATGGGATGSSYGNKMNEAGPHRAWAHRLLERAAVFGVSREGHGIVEVLAALERQAPVRSI